MGHRRGWPGHCRSSMWVCAAGDNDQGHCRRGFGLLGTMPAGAAERWPPVGLGNGRCTPCRPLETRPQPSVHPERFSSPRRSVGVHDRDAWSDHQIARSRLPEEGRGEAGNHGRHVSLASFRADRNAVLVRRPLRRRKRARRNAQLKSTKRAPRRLGQCDWFGCRRRGKFLPGAQIPPEVTKIRRHYHSDDSPENRFGGARHELPGHPHSEDRPSFLSLSGHRRVHM